MAKPLHSVAKPGVVCAAAVARVFTWCTLFLRREGGAARVSHERVFPLVLADKGPSLVLLLLWLMGVSLVWPWWEGQLA